VVDDDAENGETRSLTMDDYLPHLAIVKYLLDKFSEVTVPQHDDPSIVKVMARLLNEVVLPDAAVFKANGAFLNVRVTESAGDMNYLRVGNELRALSELVTLALEQELDRPSRKHINKLSATIQKNGNAPDDDEDAEGGARSVIFGKFYKIVQARRRTRTRRMT